VTAEDDGDERESAEEIADPAAPRWIHPLPAVAHRLPLEASRRFGAHREGEGRPPECGGGHCGIDFFADRGTPVLAVAGGVVERVFLDASRPSGKYVSLRHDDGTCSQYMHLDAVAAGLRAGDAVAAGQPIGRVGQTGFTRSLPHLHFAYRVRRPGGERFADPAARLERAEVVARPPDAPADASDDGEPAAPSI
jgi:murein DD-endopeptidase MepM/ murein hydrolase activator NlpD